MFLSEFEVSNSPSVPESKSTLQSKMAALSFKTDLFLSWKIKGSIINK